MTGSACGAGNAYPSGAPDSPLVFIDIHVVLSFVDEVGILWSRFYANELGS